MANTIRPINTAIGEYKRYNAQPILLAVESYIRILETKKKNARYYYDRLEARGLKIGEIYDDLSIFDWWGERLSLPRLKEMRTFLREAVKLGYTGYVCFKVGASGCANGMWAHRVPTTDGYSPKGEFLYRSFTPDYTYWDICDYSEGYGDKAFKLTAKVGKEFDELTTKAELEMALKAYKEVA